MGKFHSHDAGDGFGDSAERLGIVWPALPWQCPNCGTLFRDHANTIATLDVKRYEHPEETTFLCIICDLATFSASQAR